MLVRQEHMLAMLLAAAIDTAAPRDSPMPTAVPSATASGPPREIARTTVSGRAVNLVG
ncbi:MAG: hypothetical protein JO101_01020, partial [Candidatus Eremiobacteraeota bacterium]|nr:hypothetical protein [Candidatus Eremiobacteraeota bacterium]